MQTSSPILVAESIAKSFAGVHALKGVSFDLFGGEDWFDPSCFAGVDTARFGTSAFYPLHGPHQFDWDSALFRDFKLTERFNLQFRAEAFNFSNTPTFSNPSGSCDSLKNGGCSNGGFGQVTGTTSFARHGNNFRQFEFSARLTF